MFCYLSIIYLLSIYYLFLGSIYYRFLDSIIYLLSIFRFCYLSIIIFRFCYLSLWLSMNGQGPAMALCFFAWSIHPHIAVPLMPAVGLGHPTGHLRAAQHNCCNGSAFPNQAHALHPIQCSCKARPGIFLILVLFNITFFLHTEPLESSILMKKQPGIT